jgi:hypothetical protein
MLRKWRKFWALPWPQRRLLVRVILLLPWIEIGIRLCGLRWTQAQLARFVPTRPIRDHLSPEVMSVVVAGAAAAVPFPATCLRRSLVLWWLLKRRGIASEIRIGAQGNAGSFKAHAWVEWEGGQSDSPSVLKHLAVFRRVSKQLR